MRRGARIGQAKPEVQTSKMGRDMDWMLDQWNTSSPDGKLQLVLAKIRAEEKLLHEPNKKVL
jgi:hypothetical protein